MADVLPFDVEPRDRPDVAQDTFRVDVDGFEGPLDLLLELARRQKVDLNRISVLALAEQYLAFIEAARRVRLELAADYLVMAAWLAFLKSRLLLPEPPKPDEMGAADLAAALADRLRRLEAIRTAAEQMINRARVGRDVALRGGGEGIQTIADPRWQATLHDLLSAYARQRQTQALSRVTFARRAVWSLEDARATLERLTGIATEWTVLDDYLLDYCVTPEMARTVRASSFSASLEFVREGKLDIRQDRAFAPLWVPAAVRPPAGRGRVGPMGQPARMFPFEEERDADAAAHVARVLAEAVRIAEALLFASAGPLDEGAIAERLPEGVSVGETLARLRADYDGRGVTLARAGRKWFFRTADDLGWLLRREEVQQRRLTRAAVETLAIVAYHQPVTRAEIEEIRGVAISKGTLDVLLETGWVRLRGRRKAPGRPITYGTTDQFLIHFGLEQVSDLPGLDELKGAGLFDGRLPKGFGVPQPDDDEALREDEEPLEESGEAPPLDMHADADDEALTDNEALADDEPPAERDD